MFDIAILCGGMATRLYPITEKIPKSLIEINGVPFIHHQLKLLEKSGFSKVVLCTGHFGEQIQEFVSKNEYKMEVLFSQENEPLGTGGAIKHALCRLGNRFFVTYGDSYLPVKYKKIEDTFVKSDALGLMTIYKNKNSKHQNNIIYNKKTNTILNYNKINYNPEMKYIDFGLGVFCRSAFFHVKENKFDLSLVYQELLKYNLLASFVMSEQFYEVGSIEGIAELDNFIKEKI